MAKKNKVEEATVLETSNKTSDGSYTVTDNRNLTGEKPVTGVNLGVEAAELPVRWFKMEAIQHPDALVAFKHTLKDGVPQCTVKLGEKEFVIPIPFFEVFFKFYTK